MKQSSTKFTFLRLISILFLISAKGLFAQVTMPADGGTASVSSCSMTLLDPGGTGNYANNHECTYTICSNTPGQYPRITFTSFNTESGWDYVYVYNGNSTAAPLLGSYSGTTIPPVLSATGNCITIYFDSDGSNVAAGFSANISCYVPPPPPVPNNQDCLGAIPVCQNVYNQAVAYSGTGNVPNEIDPNPSCLGSGERNDVWYQFTVQQSGNLAFSITPNTITDDYDWAVYNLTTNNCGDIYSNAALEVSCNYSGISGVTGPNGLAGVQNNAVIPVTAGQTYAINVSQFSVSTAGYSLNFGASSAVIFDNVPPAINSLVATPACGATTFSFNFSENVLCSTVSTADFTLAGPGGPYTITGVSGVNCANGAPSENTFTVTTTPAITTAGTYSLCLGSAAGSVTDLCGNVAPAGCFNFTIAGPTVAVTPTSPNCSGGTGTIVAVGSGGTGSGYTYSINGGAFGGSGTFTGLAAGTYTVTTQDGGGCRGQNTAVITIPAVLTVTLTPTNATCVGNNGSITTTVAGGTPGYTYAWSPSGAGANPGSLAPNTYSVTVTDTRGCTATANTTITQTGSVTSSFTSSPNQCLNGNSFTFTNTGTVAATHAWTFPSGTPGTSAAVSPAGVTWATAGTYTVTHTVTSGACVSTTTVAIVIFPRPNGPALAGVNPTCGNSNGTINVTAATGGTPAYQYNLNGGAFGALTNYTGQAAGTYTVGVRDANGCTNTTTVTLTNTPGPTALALTPATAHCSQSDGSITIGAVTGGTAGYTYSFNNPAGPFTATSPITGLATGTYSVTVRDVNGCIFTTTATVANAAGPTGPNASSTNTSCGGSTGTVTLSPPTTGTGPYTYSFNGSGFTTTTNYTGLAANTYTYVVRDNFGCTLNGSITVNNNPGPTGVVLTPVNASCGTANGSFTIGAVTGGTAGYTYSVNGSGFTATTSYPGLAAGTYTVVVRDVNGCTFTANTTINNSSGPTALVVNHVNSNCGAGNGSITIGAVTGGVAAYTYSFNASGFTATTNYPGLVAGTYTVVVRDANGCTFSTTHVVGNNPGPTAVVLTPVNATCGTANGSFTIGAVTGGGGTNQFSVNAGAFTGTTSYTGLAAGTYTVVVRDVNGCTFTANTTIGNTPGPTAVALTPVNSTCGTANGSFTIGAVTGGTAAYTYSVAPVGGGFTATTSYTNLAAGTYTVTVRDVNNCTFVATTVIGNTPGPTAVALTPVNTSCGGATGTLTIGAVTGGTAAYTYSVTPGPAGSNPTTSFTALTAGTYTVIVRDANGCTYTQTSVVGNNPGPTAVALTPVNSTCGNANGSFTIGAVTGGTAGFTYSVNGSGFTATTSYPGLAAGTYTVVVRDVNGCTFTANTTINNSGGPTAVVLTPVSATCGSANGSFTIGAVTGGAAGYTYSVNGGGFSGTTSYTGLAAGTYTVVVRDANGCDFTSTTSISNSSGPTAQAMSSTNSACSTNTGTVTFGATTGGTGINTYSFNGGAFSGTTVYTNVAAGTYTVTVRDGSGCQFSTTVTVGTVAGPTALVLTPANSTCGNANGSITVGAVTGGGGGNQFSLNGGAFLATTSYTGLAAGTHTVVVRDVNGCTFSQTVVIANTPGPTAFAVSATSSTCGNPNGTATAGAVTTSGSTTFQYSINGGALGATTTFTGLAAATYTLLVQDANGCTFTNTVTVTNLAGPTAQVLTPVNSTCGTANGSVAIGATTGGNGSITYSFNGGAFSSTTSYTSLAAGTYTVIAQDINNCQFTQTTVVANLPGPTAVALTPVSATCGASNGSVTIGAVTGGSGTNTYSFNGSPFTATTTYTGLLAGTYTVVVQDVNLCPFTQTVSIGNSGGPSAVVLTPANSTCGNPNGSIAIGAVTGGSGTITYSLNGSAFSSTINYTGLVAGTYTVDVRDVNGCTFTQTTTISDTPGPTAVVLTPVNSTCGSPNGSFTVGAVTGGTGPGYTYSVNAGAFTATTNYTGLAAGTHTVVVRDVNGCTFSQTVVIANTAGPTAVTLTPVNSTCGNNNGQINVGAVSTTGSTTFQYSIDGGALQAGTNFTNLSAATHTIIVQDANGCQYTSTVNVLNTPGPSAQAVNTTNSTCGNANGIVTIGATTGGTAAYLFSFDGGAFVATTTYTVTAATHTVIVQDANLCTFTVTAVVANTAGPTAVTLSSTGSNCGNANGTVTVDAVTGGTTAYQYSINGGALQSGTVFPGLLPATYTVTVTDASTCTVTNTVTVINLGSPTAIVSAQTNVSCNGGNNGTAAITASGGSGSGYVYTLNTGQTNGTGIFNGLSAATYTLTLTDGAGCIATTTFTITQPAVLNGSIQTQTNVSCFSGTNGAVTVTETGGTGPFNYSINGGAFAASASFTGLSATNYTVTVRDNLGCTSNVTVLITQPTAISLAFTSVNANCTDDNGTATVIPSGGTPGYSQVWTGGGGSALTTIPVVAGTYSVTVTDANNCTATGNTTIGVTPGGTASVSSSVNVTCNGANNGSITVSMGGGATAPFTYFWTPNVGTGTTVTGLAPGTYSVTVTDDHGCTATTNATITQPLSLNVGFTSTNVSCNGGSDGTINSNVTGGTSPYTYSWSPGAFNTAVISGIPVGAYTLTATDAQGCIVTGTRNVTQPTALTITPTITNPHCGLADGSATVSGAGGAGGYTYSINGGAFGPGSFTSLSATTYTITIRDANNCTANLPLTLVDQSGPTASITASTNVSCNGGTNGSATVTASGGVTPYIYSWTPSSQTTQTANNLAAGVYGVVVTDASGCSAAAAVTITQPAVLQINATGTDPVCNGQSNGTGAASAFGGTIPYSFQWAVLPIQNTANATGLSAGVHNVTVTDANLCTATTSINLVNPPLLTVTINKTDLLCNSICNGTAAAVTTNGTSPFLFAWNDPNSQTSQTATGLCAGGYTVNVTDFRGCTAVANTTITQPTLLTTAIVNPVNVTCAGLCNGSGAVSPAGGTTPYSYSWSNSVLTPVNNNLCVGSYTATVTDGNGCTSQSTLTIVAPNPLVVSATGTNATCYNLCDGTATANFSGGTAPYTFLWQPSLAPTFNAAALCDGTHTVTVTDNNGCSQQATVVITEPAQLVATTAVSNNNFCGQSNGTAQVMISGGTPNFTYSWSNGGNTALISSLPGGPYSVNITDANGCIVNAVANVIDIPAPTLTLNNFTDITCFGLNNGTALVTMLGGTAPITPQTWLMPGTLQPNPVQSGNGNGTNLYPGNNVFTVVDAAGCVASITIPIAEPTQLVSALNNINHVTCSGLSNGSATMLLNGGTTPYTYLWTDGSAQSTSTAINLAAGTYTCNVSDANGCPTSQSVTINQPLPLAIINNSVSNITCYGDANGSVNITPTGGTPAYNYSWSPNSADLGPVVTNLAPGIYQLQVTDSKGCVQNSAYNITQPDSFIVNVLTTPSRCSNPNASIQLVVTGASPNYTYSWNSPTPQSNATAVGLAAPGTYNCLITDTHGCIRSVTASVSDEPAPTIDSITVTNVTCYGFGNGTATVYPKPGGNPVFTYQWSLGATPVSSAQLATALIAGNYNVVVTDANGCTVTGVATIAQPFPLTINVSTDQIACNGQVLGVYASAGNGTPPYVYNWTGAGSGLNGGGNHNVTFANTNQTSTIQSYSVSATDANGCPAVSGQFNVTVLPKITPVALDVTGCVGNTVTLNATAFGGDGAPYTFTWGVTPPVTPQVGDSSEVTVPVLSTAPASYNLSISDGCSNPESMIVNVFANPTPNAVLIGNNTEGCADLLVSFSGSGGPAFPGCTYNWTFGDNAAGTDSTTSHLYQSTDLQVDSFDVQLIVTSPLGCSDTVRVNNYVIVYPRPIAEFTFDPMNTTEFDPLINFYNQSQGAASYSWNFGEPTSTTNTSNLENPVHSYLNSGYYTTELAVMSDRGCADTVSHPIYIEPEFAIYVPNAFSPNEDLKNQTFFPQGIGIDESRYQMYIFDRWGEIIFETNNFSKGWDGTAKGKSTIVQQDVYVYKIIVFDLKSNKHTLTGHVTVVR